MCSIITYKATRGPKLAKAGLSTKEAAKFADNLYDQWKILFSHKLAASSVSVMIVTDEDAGQILQEAHVDIQDTRIVYQCGGW